MAQQGSNKWNSDNQEYYQKPYNKNQWVQERDGNFQRSRTDGYQERPNSSRNADSRRNSGRHKGRPINRSGEEHEREPSPDRTGFDHINYATDKDESWRYNQGWRGRPNRGSYRGSRSYNRDGFEQERHFSASSYHENSNKRNWNEEPIEQFPVGQWGSGPEENANRPRSRENARSSGQQQYDKFGRQNSKQKILDEVQDTQEGPIWHLTKNLSYFLRHGYEKDGYTLMNDGYMYIEDVLKIPRFQQYSEEDIRHVTSVDPIGRFTITEDEETKKPMVKANFLQTKDTANPHIHLSKTLSYLLRHGAEKHGFQLMPGGYLYVDEVLRYESLKKYTEEDVIYVVKTNSKQRFALQEEEGTKRLMIRANQGHSVQVEGLDLKPIQVVDEAKVVIHGTYYAAWEIIKQQGLSRMGRNHIHFAVGEPDEDGVISGMRKSAEVLIYIDLGKCLRDGIKFYRSSNDVILSDGNAEGFIYPCYFQFALSRKPRHKLDFDGSVAHQVTTIVGGEHLKQESKKKKKKKKKHHGDREESMDEDDKNHMTDVQRSKVTDGNEVGVSASRTDGVAIETVDDHTEEVLEHIKFTDIDECKHAVSILSASQDPVAVWCFGNQLGESNGTIRSIVCVTQKKAYFFDLTSSLDLIDEGGLGDYFNAKDTSVKVFHECGKVSYTMFYKCKIILDGTNVYDTAVAYQHAKTIGVGNLSELADIGFTPDKWTDIDESMDGQVIFRCKVMLQAYDKFKSWYDKPPKKEIFEEVMSLLPKDEVKAAREKRKKELHVKQKQQQTPKGKKGKV